MLLWHPDATLSWPICYWWDLRNSFLYSDCCYDRRDQCRGVEPVHRILSQTTSTWKQSFFVLCLTQERFLVWLFLSSPAFINGLWPFIEITSEATIQCLSKFKSLIHSCEQNKNSFWIDVKTHARNIPQALSIIPQPANTPVWTAADIDWPWPSLDGGMTRRP